MTSSMRSASSPTGSSPAPRGGRGQAAHTRSMGSNLRGSLTNKNHKLPPNRLPPNRSASSGLPLRISENEDQLLGGHSPSPAKRTITDSTHQDGIPIRSEQAASMGNIHESEREDQPTRSASGAISHERGGAIRRDSNERTESFMKRETPRPSVVFLEGINIEDLFKDDDFDIDVGDNSTQYTSSSSPSTAISRLTSEERQALQTLNSTNNSFLDIVNIMLMNSLSATVNNEGLHALSLVHDPDVKLLEECAGSCGFEVIVSAMGKCSKDAMAQTNACKVLFIASASGEDLQIAIGHAGGIEALVDAMREFDDDVIVLEGCLLALSNLCIPEENLNYALEGELIELAVNAMSKNVENCGLQEHGCAVLANLAVQMEAQRRIRNCGGCDTVVVSMVVNPMDIGVQCQALVALRNLCVRDEENKVVLANAGAIDVVIQAMQNHRDDATIQGAGSWVLGIIGMNEDNKIYIGEHGGAQVIVRSMWVHADDTGVQEKACRALWTLSVHPQNRFTILEVDAIPAIVAAMQNHAAEPNIQERGCGVLCNMAANDDELKIQIVEDGALDVIVMAMVLHGENEMIQERAVALLCKLCIPENIERMVNSNVSPMMAVVAVNFPELQEKASYVLTQLQV